MSDDVRVLVVDDSAFFGTLVAGKLSDRYGMKTERTTSALDALDHLESTSFDCVVSDYDMPEMDGIELFRTIRNGGIDVPFFLLTAAGSEEVASEAITAGVDDYFPKTEGEDQFEILGKRITNVVEQRRAANTLDRQRQLHGTLWQITQELMGISSRTEIARSVCEGLVTDERFTFAWLRDDKRREPVTAGTDPEMCKSLRESAQQDGFVDTARAEKQVQTAHVETGAAGEPAELTAIPLSYQRSCFGSLVVATENRESLTDSEQEALTHLGTTVGHAFASVQMEREVEIFRQTVEQADTAICITDNRGKIEYANSAFGAITGYDPDAVAGEPVEILATDGWDRSFYESAWEQVRQGESVRREVVQQAADGAQFYADLSVAPLRPDGEQIENFILIESDITELKSNEQRLEVLNRVLRHNLRNDLNVVQGNLDLVLESLPEGEERSRVRRARRKAESLLSLGEKAQFVNKAVGAVDERETHAEVDLADLLTTEIEVVGERYPEATLTLETNPSAATRGAQLHVAIRELLDNAIRHNDSEPRVRITTDRAASPDGLVYIDIIDNGPGLPENERKTLARGRETELMHGSSLGLWLVHWIVTHIGGHLDIQRTDDSGTTIRLSLPVIDS